MFKIRLRGFTGWPAGAVLLCACSGLGQAVLNPSVQAPGVSALTQSTGPGRTALPSESLGPDDLIEVMVSYSPELSRTFRVAADGSLALPLLRDRLMVKGLTPLEVSHLIEKQLEQNHVMVDPVVSVSVLEYRSRPVSVVGAVNHPLIFQAVGQTTLLDAIANAGGLSPTAGGRLIVTRHGAAAGSVDAVRVIPVAELIGGDNPALNLKLQGGEEIRIPEASKIFVAGNVRRPGSYAMQSDADTTVRKAIALSEGLQPYTADTAYIYRRTSGGSRDEIAVPLNNIIKRKAPDVDLRADDILYIPDSSGRRLTGKVLSQITGFGQTAGTGLLIYK